MNLKLALLTITTDETKVDERTKMVIVYVRPFVLSSMAESEAQVASFKTVD
jgi:hypothetical protein